MMSIIWAVTFILQITLCKKAKSNTLNLKKEIPYLWPTSGILSLCLINTKMMHSSSWNRCINGWKNLCWILSWVFEYEIFIITFFRNCFWEARRKSNLNYSDSTFLLMKISGLGWLKWITTLILELLISSLRIWYQKWSMKCLNLSSILYFLQKITNLLQIRISNYFTRKWMCSGLARFEGHLLISERSLFIRFRISRIIHRYRKNKEGTVKL